MPVQDQSVSESRQLATFRIGDELFGLGINSIREIVRYPDITGVPRSPAYLTGLANMRGNVLPVVDARLRLGVKVAPISDMTRVLVVETDGLPTGLVVDRVCGVISLESASVEDPPPLLTSGVDTRYVKSVLKVDGGRKIIMEINAENMCLTEIAAAGLAKQEKSRTRVAAEQTAVKELQLVTFLVAREEYAFPIASVREVLRIGAITEVPDEPPYILGILSVRNTLLPVVDLRRLFGLPSLAENLHHELADVAAYAAHVGEAFDRLAQSGAAWNPDSTSAAVTRWMDSLHTASDALGRQYQTLRALFIRLLQTVRQDPRARNLPALLEEARGPVASLVDQIRLKVSECQNLLAVEVQEDQRILVIEIGAMPVGILVDRMNQVIRLPEHCIETPPPLLNSEKASSLQGIVKLDDGKRLIMLLDQDAMLNSPDLQDLYSASCASRQEEDRTCPVEDPNCNADFIQLVTFRLGDEEYGISIDEVQEINRFEHLTSVPRSPAFVEGVMNLRGNVIPAIDLRKRFGLDEVAHDEATRVIIVTMNGRLTGLIVDAVSEVFRLQRSSIDPPPSVIASNAGMEFIKGICKDSHTGKKMVVMLDVSRLLAHHEQLELNAVVNAEADAVKAASVLKPVLAPELLQMASPAPEQTQPEPVTEPDPVAIPEPVTELLPEPEQAPDTETMPEPELMPQSETVQQAEATPDTETMPEAATEPSAETKVESPVEPVTEPTVSKTGPLMSGKKLKRAR